MRRLIFSVILIILCVYGLAMLCTPAEALAATYYVDFDIGSNTNSGLSPENPWKHAPGMKGFAGIYTHNAGDKFVFKGGVKWGASAFPLTIAYSGSQNNPDTYGVDQGWYKGASWTKPIFDGENVTKNFILANNKDYIVFDGIEFTGADNDYPDTGTDMPIVIDIDYCDNWEFENCYWHHMNTKYDGTRYSNGGRVLEESYGNNFKFHDNVAEHIYMHRPFLINANSNSGLEFYNNKLSDSAVLLTVTSNRAGGDYDNISIHDNEFSNVYVPYADHSSNDTKTQLSGAIDASQTTINLIDGSMLPSGYNFVVQIDNEYIYVPGGARSGNILNSVTRGWAGSTATLHSVSSDTILRCSDPWHGDFIQIYTWGTGTGYITNLKIYNNYFHDGGIGPMPPYPCNSSTWDGGMTAYLYLDDERISSPLVYNNVFTGPGSNVGYMDILGPNAKIYSNTIYGTGATSGGGNGIYLSREATGADIKNNIFSNLYLGIYETSTINGTISDNNIFYNVKSIGRHEPISPWFSTLSSWQTYLGGCPGEGNDCNSLTSDPLFVDPANKNFHLQSNSTAIDKGIALTTPFNVDREGVTRPQGSDWDIGAYEYTGSQILYGDVSENGSVSAYDASLASQYAVGLITLTSIQITKADVSGNGSVSAFDASLIAQYAVGLITKFPVQG